MMQTRLESISIGKYTIELLVPVPESVQQTYRLQIQKDSNTAFPYWTKIWPAAISMTEFLSGNTHLIKNKKVLELAGGLGLPSLYAAHYANEVCCSDYLPEAVAVMEQSVKHNKLTNMQCGLLNWNHLPEDLLADTLLLSDINYDPIVFETLYLLIQGFLNRGCTVILSTPQRLMAKPFIDRLAALCIQQQELTVIHQNMPVLTMVMVLKKLPV
jgi:predicted nicotinamide N-methyase